MKREITVTFLTTLFLLFFSFSLNCFSETNSTGVTNKGFKNIQLQQDGSESSSDSGSLDSETNERRQEGNWEGRSENRSYRRYRYNRRDDNLDNRETGERPFWKKAKGFYLAIGILIVFIAAVIVVALTKKKKA